MRRLLITVAVLLSGVSQSLAQPSATPPPASSPALFDALKDDDLGAMKRLLKNGASPVSRDAYGHGILQIAAQNGNIDAMKLLLAAGADIDAPDRLQMPPLQYAVSFNQAARAEGVFQE